MQRKPWALVAIAVLLLITVGCRSTSTVTPKQLDQTAIEADIRSQIATHYPGETFDIGIEVSNEGVVKLTGTVNDSDKRTRIVEIARGTSGVKRVIDEIKVS